jgi:hypothetical protein
MKKYTSEKLNEILEQHKLLNADLTNVKLSSTNFTTDDNFTETKVDKLIDKFNNYESFDDWVVDLLKLTPEGRENYLLASCKEFLKDGNVEALFIALRQIAKAKG